MGYSSSDGINILQLIYTNSAKVAVVTYKILDAAAKDYLFVASIIMALVQCSMSSVCDGGGGKGGRSTIAHPSARLSDFPVSAMSVA